MTSTANKPINLKEIYFKHAALTRITGNPKYADLQSMYRECKANAQSVPCNIGGGANGHLGLIISANAYNTISPGTAYFRPTNPAPYVQGENATGPQIAEGNRRYHEATRLFQEANQLESTLQNQIAAALDSTVMMPCLNEETGTVEGTVQDTMQYLFTTYGNITSASLITKKHTLTTHVYVHDDPIITIFNKIHKYAAMAEAQGAPETDQQLINIGMVIIQNATIFATHVEDWEKRIAANKTWPHFKTFFTNAQIAYKKARPTTTIAEQGYSNQANLVEEIVNELDQRRIQDDTAAAAEYEAVLAAQAAQEQLANAANTESNSTTTMEALLATMASIQAQVNNNNNNNNNYRGRGRDGGRDNGYRNQRNGANRHRGRDNDNNNNNNNNHNNGPRTAKYCWSHGNCAHPSSECNNKRNGHKNEATFSNMMNGSNYDMWKRST